MLKNYFRIAWRNLMRQKAFSAINIIGLAIGMMCSIFILLWVQHERSFDRFHENAGEIYRITETMPGLNAALSPAVMPPELQAKLPVIKNMVRITYPSKLILEAGTNKFMEEGAHYTDTTFLQVFSFPLIQGNRATALSRPDAILITRDMAKKYFATEDAMGKTLRVNGDKNAVVTGVLENIPANSHFRFDFIMPFSASDFATEAIKAASWDNFDFLAYLQLDKNFKSSPGNVADLETQINTIYREHIPRENLDVEFHLQPLTGIHLGASYVGDFPGHGNALYVRIFFIVAIFVLGVACINFMNLATARSARRAREVGLRKTVGAGRAQLIVQFLTESVFISFIALCIAIFLAWLLLPLFNDLSGKQITVNFFEGKMIWLLAGIALLTGLVAGSYPALFLSAFNPVKVLKGNVTKMSSNLTLRNGLVVLQFSVSILLLVGTLVVYKQLRFIKNMNLGFEKENLVYMPMMGNLQSKKEALEIALQNNMLTADYTIIGGLPTNLMNATTDIIWEGKDPNMKGLFSNVAADGAFFDIFQMKLLSGRTFFKNSSADSNNYIINEKAAGIMGFTPESAIGKPLTQWGIKGMVVGVVRDFNFKPVQQSIEPLIIRHLNSSGYVVVHTKPGKTEATIQALEGMNASLNSETPFSFGFIDQDLDNLYKGEQQMGSLFNVFTMLALFISCLGLYGLSAFLAEQRKQEIGVRKVLGASVLNIAYLLSSNFTKLVLIAMVIAIPVSWLAVNSWLDSFAYRTDISWVIFFIAAVAALLIAWITISYESIRAGLTNPVKALRSE